VDIHRPFAVLWRVFLTQFFSSESVTSDIHLRQVLTWVLAFLITPGVMLSLQVVSRYAFAVYRQPSLVETMTSALAIIFITYSAVTTGLVAVFVWDGLSFDRRDAMILGPMPVKGTTIIAAKLGALGTFLLAMAVATNVLSAVVFALIASGSRGIIAWGIHALAHMIANVAAGVFVFSVLITIRSLLVFLGRPQFAIAVGALLQVGFMGGLFASILVMPAALSTIVARADDIDRHAWLPTTWFLGLHETLRGRRTADFASLAVEAVVATILAASRRNNDAWRHSPGAICGEVKRRTEPVRLSRGIRNDVERRCILVATLDVLIPEAERRQGWRIRRQGRSRRTRSGIGGRGVPDWRRLRCGWRPPVLEQRPSPSPDSRGSCTQ
jgi:hypothetical protein